jgi:hypothetical protein
VAIEPKVETIDQHFLMGEDWQWLPKIVLSTPDVLVSKSSLTALKLPGTPNGEG